MTTMMIGTMTSQIMPHQSRLYMINLLVVLAPNVVHIPLPLTRFSPSSVTLDSFNTPVLYRSEFELSMVFPIAFGKEFYAPSLCYESICF